MAVTKLAHCLLVFLPNKIQEICLILIVGVLDHKRLSQGGTLSLHESGKGGHVGEQIRKPDPQCTSVRGAGVFNFTFEQTLPLKGRGGVEGEGGHS